MDRSLENFSDAELRDMMYKKLTGLLKNNPTKYRRCIAYHIETLEKAGKISRAPGTLANLKWHELN